MSSDQDVQTVPWFDRDFLESLPSDQFEAMLRICDRLEELLQVQAAYGSAQREMADAYSFLQVYLERHPGFESFKLPPGDMLGGDGQAILCYLSAAVDALKREATRKCNQRLQSDSYARYARELPGAVTYEFADDDFKRLQKLVSEIRNLIIESPLITDNHRRRLLSRLEKLQSELHKRMSNVDILFAFVLDLGVVLGEFGGRVKPLTDRAKEVAAIVLAAYTATHAGELPRGNEHPSLPPGNE